MLEKLVKPKCDATVSDELYFLTLMKRSRGVDQIYSDIFLISHHYCMIIATRLVCITTQWRVRMDSNIVIVVAVAAVV